MYYSFNTSKSFKNVKKLSKHPRQKTRKMLEKNLVFIFKFAIQINLKSIYGCKTHLNYQHLSSSINFNFNKYQKSEF